MKPDGSLTDLEMWSYWRDAKGYRYALESQYPKILKKSTALQSFLETVQAMEKGIDLYMEKLAQEENERNDWEDK